MLFNSKFHQCTTISVHSKAIFSLRLKLNVTRQFHTHALCMELISCGILWMLGLFPDLEYFIGFSST